MYPMVVWVKIFSATVIDSRIAIDLGIGLARCAALFLVYDLIES